MRPALRLAALALGVWLGGRHPAQAQVHTAGCPNCHRAHGVTGATLTDYTVSEDLCLSCHVDGGDPNAPKGVAVHVSVRYGATVTCVTCHGHRGSAAGNLALIRDSIATPNSGRRDVNFFSRGTDAIAGTPPSALPGAGPAQNSFADGDATLDGVCEVCHTQTANHQNGTIQPDLSNHAHNAGLQCTKCHLHRDANGRGFTGGGPCAACHDVGGQGTTGPNSRRPVIPELARASHHVGSTYLDSDCQTCHDMSAHQQGNVRLKNADDPATVYVLTGNPATSPAEAAKLTFFCLSCHDANGAGGRIKPFSDSVVVPAVDSTRWMAAAHRTAPAIAGCFGDGNFGCHATAHGSAKRKLLAPPTVAPTAPANAEEEEGFCLNCHRAGGSSQFDLKTAFDKPINWVAQATGLQNNANLNDRHDVQYAASSRSGYKIECTDCHDPHLASQALPYKLDPDPNDGHVVGTNWYFAAYATAKDTLSEFCLDCHDNSWAPGIVVQPSATAVTDIKTTWAADGMGARTSSNVNLAAGVGWGIGDVLPCRSCHMAHVRMDRDFADTTNLFQAVDTVRGKSATPPYWNGALLQGYTGNTTKSFAYGIITNANTTDPTRDAATWCNTCHARTAMLSKDNCYTCHRHGDGGRF